MKLNTSEEFVEAMWSALIESPDFKPMIEAWDRALDDDDYAPEQNVKQLAAGMHGELARLEIALQAKVQAVKHDPALLRDHVDSYIKLAENKAIVSSSSAVATLKLDLEKLQLALHDVDFSVPGTHLVWGEEADGIDRHLLALTPVDASAPLPNTYLLKRLETDWPDAYDKILSRMFALSPAEIEILKDLYLGFESSAIAERRGRSVHTVRTQIKSIMEKIGVNNQRRLVRLLSTLFQLDASDGIRPATTDCYARHAFDLNQEQRLEYCEYGDPKGRVVVLITPTISPQPSPFIGKLALNNNLRVIAPFRPGSGLSSTRGSSDGPEAIAKDYFQLLDELGIEKAQVVGCDSGGLYAMALAGLLGERCDGVAIVSTGVPIKSLSTILKMPASSRRTFLVARLSPSLLYAPHRVAANDFHLSKDGEDRLVRYFFEGHAHDLNRVENDPFFYKAIRNLIAFSFQDVECLVHDVTYWAQDWSQLLNGLPKSMPKLSIVGAENRQFKTQEVLAWCEANGWQASVFEDEGQLLVFSKAADIAELIVQQVTNK